MSTTTGSAVVSSQIGAAVNTSVIGVGMAVWFDITKPGISQTLTGFSTTRWPGGTPSDSYHWQTNTMTKCNGYNYQANQNSTFDNFMNDVAIPAHLDTSIVVNYGSNSSCTGGGDPAEAAAWVKYANATKGYNIKWWTVGAEQYGSWSLNLNNTTHDPAAYAQIFGQFYQQMKAASPTPINVCVDADPNYPPWDPTVFAQATFDCVELHYYPQQQNTIDDTTLLTSSVSGLTTFIQKTQSELTTAGKTGTPIFVGEIGSTTGTPGKQTLSVVQALYAGQAVGEMLNDGVARATWHIGYTSCNPASQGGDFDRKIYGWQGYGDAAIFAGGDIVSSGCASSEAPFGTPLPTAVALTMTTHFVQAGQHMLPVALSNLPNMRAYAATYSGRTALMLFNLSKTQGVHVTVQITGRTSGSGTTWLYDKASYDASQNNVWNGATSQPLRSWRGSFSVTLPAWSMEVIQT